MKNIVLILLITVLFAGCGKKAEQTKQKTVQDIIDRGALFLERNDNDTAVIEYTEAIRFDPDHAPAYKFRGDAYSNMGDYDRAIADYTQAIRIDPDYANPYNNRGNIYVNKGDYDRAIAEYSEAIRIDPNLAAAYNNRGMAYSDKDDGIIFISCHALAFILNLQANCIFKESL